MLFIIIVCAKLKLKCEDFAIQKNFKFKDQISFSLELWTYLDIKNDLFYNLLEHAQITSLGFLRETFQSHLF